MLTRGLAVTFHDSNYEGLEGINSGKGGIVKRHAMRKALNKAWCGSPISRDTLEKEAEQEDALDEV
jgi:hypothetical protein